MATVTPKLHDPTNSLSDLTLPEIESPYERTVIRHKIDLDHNGVLIDRIWLANRRRWHLFYNDLDYTIFNNLFNYFLLQSNITYTPDANSPAATYNALIENENLTYKYKNNSKYEVEFDVLQL